ncbi:MAG: SOS response-associated peptidase [Demequinaceae bacterium]|nr:SOS response-associated peptidase [Demequinaceae bacterium]
MCGRYVNFLRERETIEAFAIAEVTEAARLLPPSWNVAPMHHAPVAIVSPETDARCLVTARWGLLPSWAKEPSIGAKMFNARSETVDVKPAFRSAFVKRRCLVPANGYYEWQATPEGKMPHFIHPADDSPAAFAGLWEIWGQDRLLTFTILTTATQGDLARIHDRQPVMLTPEARDAWMDPRTTPDELRAVIASKMPPVEARPVGRDVGNVHNNHSGLIEPLPNRGEPG